MKKIEFNLNALVNSSLSAESFLILLLIQRKEYKAVETIMLRTHGLNKDLYEMLEKEGWVKITGTNLPKDVEIRQQFIELLNDTTDMDIRRWVDEYRELFRGKKPGAYGDRELCVKHLTWLLTTYEYTKEDVIKATKYYVKSQTRENYKYLMQSNYFLSKQNASTGEVAHPILSYLEEVTDKSFVETEDFTHNI